MPSIRGSLLLMLLLMPILMGSKADDWREVAEGDIAFAHELAAEGVKFDASFRKRLIEGKVAGCMPRPSRVRGLDQSDRRLLELYCLKVCLPWRRTWGEILSACDRVLVPKWCKAGHEDRAVEHIGLQGYFETLTGAIRETRTSLERGNIMELIADRLNSEILRHHPSAPLDGWVADALSVYLKTATPDEVIQIAEPICGATFGHGERVPRQFVEYRDRPGFMTEDQICAMKGILSRKDRWSCGPFSGGAVKRTAEEEAAERHLLEANVLIPRNLALLSQRIDAYYEMEREGRCRESYEFLALDLREGGHDEKGWVHTCEHLRRQTMVVEWQVNRARAMGNRVKVYTLVHYKNRSGERKGQEWSREWEDYWVFEEGTWNYALGLVPEVWSDQQAIEVQIPRGSSGESVEQGDDEKPEDLPRRQ